MKLNNHADNGLYHFRLFLMPFYRHSYIKYASTVFSLYIEDLLHITSTLHASLILISYHWNDSCTITNGSVLSLLVIGFTYALISSENLSPLCLYLLPWFAQLGSALADLITGTGPIMLSFPRDSQYIGRRPTSWPLGSWPKTGPSFDSHVIRCASAPVNGPDTGELSLCAKQTRRLTWCRAIVLIGYVRLRERLCLGRVHSEQAIPSSCTLQRPLPFPVSLLRRTPRWSGYLLNKGEIKCCERLKIQKWPAKIRGDGEEGWLGYRCNPFFPLAILGATISKLLPL